ncbi:MAG: DUF480 domain-containing protein [Woeseia sp.]|nr:DUF480 domain-containing protein [Woeseia sp.]MBT8097562.1 DUF480 domain-containing protein [Woeseia sp.]NNE61344.1 DUF480 domain-containing protein [Woeseia sp.]NNL55731.1 DUF480 domain-containing protein [Woeseia sp.]
MTIVFNAEEARIIGCLIEKSIVTPNQYPLSLNSLTNACNQKSGRNPTMGLTKGEVQRHARLLDGKNQVRIDENFRSGVEKYSQRLCNTRYSDYQFEDDQLALVCVLLLRGPQTPGELRTHCRRLHAFADNAAVVASLKTLAEHTRGPLVQELPRTPGRKDAEYMHLLSGPIDVSAHASVPQAASGKSSKRAQTSDLQQRIAELEAEVAELRARLAQQG